MTTTLHRELVEDVNDVYTTLKINLTKSESTNIRNAYLKINYVGKNNQLLKSDKIQLTYDEILNCFVSDNEHCSLNPKLINKIYENISCTFMGELWRYSNCT
jgi:hypothetical protein